jgi:hypothetical protein
MIGRVGVLWVVLLALPATAQDLSQVRIRGIQNGSDSAGTWTFEFDCIGSPVCVGSSLLTDRWVNCSNALSVSGQFRLTGLNLSAPGPLAGTAEARPSDYDLDRNGDGTCSIRPGSLRDFVGPYTGQWDGTNGTLALDALDEAPVRFKVERPPVFPMVVRATIDAVSATAAADIQFRAQDVGTTGSVFVFATAPSSRVQGGNAPGVMKIGLARHQGKAFEKADSCVISQLNSAGQLIAVTAAQLQAYLSGALSSQGASITIMDRVPTPNVAGATFYVGYGTSAQKMLTDGIFRNAVLVPGSDVCPMMPLQTALWWNARESGWGVNFNHQGSTLFGTLFTYDANRTPLWLVMSDGRMQADGVTYLGDLYRTTGPAFNASPFTPIGPSNLTRVGTMTVKFGDANAGTLTYTMEGVQVAKDIERQIYGSRAANCLPTGESRVASTNYQDLWWNPAESGWGVNITHQDNTLFATLFTYDASGRGLWLVMSNGARQSDGSFLGELYQTSGPAFNATPFSGVTVQAVGTMRLRFADGNNGTLSYTYNGASVTKAIQRQVFSSTFSTCN